MCTKQRKSALLLLLPVLLLLLGSCGNPYQAEDTAESETAVVQSAADAAGDAEISYTMDTIPEFSGEPWVVINDNQPEFDDDLKATQESFEYYGDLDYLARCTACEANIGTDLMPTDERGSIGSVHPSGWIQAQYDCISGKDLYNRCHLIGYQLTAENANPNNLITGTRYLNIDGMLPFENLVADYVKETQNHVLYRVTPVFEGDELVARGVHMEGWSMEDSGEGVCFNVYCYNVQPGVEIDYASGASTLAASDSIYAIHEGAELEAESVNAAAAELQNAESEGTTADAAAEAQEEAAAADGQTAEAQTTEPGVQEASEEETHDYVLNTKTKKFHEPDCSSVAKLGEENRSDVTCTRQELIDEGYSPCGNCKP